MESTTLNNYRRIQAGRELQGVTSAKMAYEIACRRLPLGQCIRVLEDDVGYFLQATQPIAEGQPLTSFAADGLLVRGSKVFSPLRGYGRRICNSDFTGNIYGPLHKADDSILMFFINTIEMPAPGFPVITSIVSNAAPKEIPTPDYGGPFVRSVIDSSPYDGFRLPDPQDTGPFDDELVCTYAQITSAYLQKIQAHGNVKIGIGVGHPPVLLATREIAPGEVLRTGRTPAFYLRRPAFTEAIAAQLLKPGQKCLGVSESTLRDMMGLPRNT